jgi:hypothetical protein
MSEASQFLYARVVVSLGESQLRAGFAKRQFVGDAAVPPSLKLLEVTAGFIEAARCNEQECEIVCCNQMPTCPSAVLSGVKSLLRQLNRRSEIA